MTQFKQQHLQKIRPGIVLYNQEKFWECHEALETPWMEDRGDHARNAYWAVIQVAAALIHYLNKNYEGTVGMFYKAKEKIERCEKLKVESPLMEEFLHWSQFKSLIMSIPEPPTLEDFKDLYQFRFPDPKHWKLPK